MQPLKSLQNEFAISEELSSVFPSYISITARQKDKIVAQQLTNVFATNAHYATGPTQQSIYNDFDVAYAVGIVYKLIVDQEIEYYEHVYQTCAYGANQNQMFALHLLKYMIYQLDKSEPLIYLNIIFQNKQIPLQPLNDKGIDLSKTYSFVYHAQLASLFKPLQAPQFYQFWKSIQNQSLKGISPDARYFFYQPSANFPILVLLKENLQTVQQRVFDQHTIFMKNIAIQLTLDVATRQQSLSVQNLKDQPFRFNSMPELAEAIFCGQPNFQDRCKKFLSLPNLNKTLEFLVVPQATFELIKQQIKDNQEAENVNEPSLQNNAIQSQQFDPFKTCLPDKVVTMRQTRSQ